MDQVINETQLKEKLKTYCKYVNKYYKAGNVESSYNKPVIDLLQSFGCAAHDFSGARTGTNGENIDIKLWHKDDDINKMPPFGAIEVKKVDGIDSRAKKQILIESKAYGNVILTDNATWQFYHSSSDKMYNGFVLLKKNSANEFEIDESKIDLFIATIKDFILATPTNIKSSNKLAFYMAEYAKTIKTIVFNILQSNNDRIAMYNELIALYSKLKQELLPDLEIEDFSDMYAQTIVYGLFIARYNDKSLNNFTRGEAIENLSKESHLLKQFFQHVATSDSLHPTLNDSIDKLCNLFKLTDLHKLLDQYEKKDAIVHFYEDFLNYYDLEQRKNFGAYYTPVQVVDYMVQMVDKILINEFGITGGLSNNDSMTIKIKSDPYQTKKKEWKNEKEINVPKVAILDPACGTGTFGAEIIKFIKDKYFSQGNQIFYKDWLQQENGLMSRLISFEIMMTSYVIAHLKIRRVIAETLGDEELDKNIPSNIFLTNTLAEPKSLLERNQQTSLFDFSGAITEEAENADKWKARRPIQVIIGNPPYLAASKNQYDISAYKFETDGKTPFNERKHLLNDDYVKFIRFAEQHIQKDGKGILAYITNNGYLDNVTFRGMRASLMRTFDKIYILNLHGNSIKNEVSPDGSKDENIFNIMVGVAIIIGIKNTSSTDWADVYYSDLYGTREKKFAFLENGNATFDKINVNNKTALFIPVKDEGREQYEEGISLNDLFILKSTGTDSGNDSVAIAPTKQELERRVNIVRQATDEKPIKDLFGKFGRGFTAQQIKKDVELNGKVTEIAYRPFDNRWTYYTGVGGWLSRAKNNVMQHFIKNPNNIGIIFTRGDSSQANFSCIGVTDKITDIHFFSNVAYIAPLYIESNDLITETSTNLNQCFVKKLTKNLSFAPKAQDIFDYCYASLFNLKYINEFNEFLKRDYPRVPIIKDEKQFYRFVELGKKLRDSHLMHTNIIKNLSIESLNKDLLIEHVQFVNNKIFINKNTALIGVSQEVWNYRMFGSQVIDKWLKSHKGETLDIDKFNHLQKIVGIIEETIRIQKELSKV